MVDFYGFHVGKYTIHGSYGIESKVVSTHPDIAHPIGNPPATPIMKEIPLFGLFIKVAKGVCSKGVVKQPLIELFWFW